MTKMGMDESAAGEMMAERTSEPAGESGEVSIFLSKDQLGNRKLAEGDTLTFTVESIDPETGDAELSLGESDESERPSYAKSMDEYMPMEES